MEKKHPVRNVPRQIAAPELRTAAGGARLRVPVGYTDTGEPIYENGSAGSEGKESME